MLTNFFSAGELIVNRLKATLNIPALNIRLAPNEAWALANAIDKSVAVIFFDSQPHTGQGGSGHKGTPQKITQFWMVTVSLKNVSDNGISARHEAGALVIDVLQALLGFELGKDFRYLKMEHSPKRTPDSGAYAHIPLLFSTDIIIGV